MLNIDFNRLFYNAIPHFLRSAISLSWLYSLAKPLNELNVLFNAFRSNKNYELQFTSQTVYLEHYLNDQFDSSGRGIYIVTNDIITITFIGRYFEPRFQPIEYNNSEGNPAPFVYNTIEQSLDPNFIIYVPALIYPTINLNLFNSKVKFYNQAGKTYTIQTY